MTSTASLPRSFFARHSATVARELLGCILLVDGIGGAITEVEAYDGETDQASHAYKGRTPRCASMFEQAGTLYVYRIHQSHCMNVVTRQVGIGAGVLIRAIAPSRGLATIAARRSGQPRRSWCDGPGKLTRALAIDRADDGSDIMAPESRIRVLPCPCPYQDHEVSITPRIGISKAVDLPWRFLIPKPRMEPTDELRTHSERG